MIKTLSYLNDCMEFLKFLLKLPSFSKMNFSDIKETNKQPPPTQKKKKKKKKKKEEVRDKKSVA